MDLQQVRGRLSLRKTGCFAIDALLEVRRYLFQCRSHKSDRDNNPDHLDVVLLSFAERDNCRTRLKPMSLHLLVQIVPNASRTEVIGWIGDKLKIKLKAPAVERKANDELIRTLAGQFEIRQNAIEIIHGDTTRIKLLQIEGVDVERLLELFPKGTKD